MLICTPNYHKTGIRTVSLIALLSQFASILENEAEKKLGVTWDEVLEIHRDSTIKKISRSKVMGSESSLAYCSGMD